MQMISLQRMGHAALWFVMNGAFAALLWFGFVEGVEGAHNASLCLVWANFVLSWGMLVPGVRKELAKKGRSVPAVMNVLYDLGVTFFLVWFGAWVSAVAYAVHIGLQEVGGSAQEQAMTSPLNVGRRPNHG